MRIRTVSIPLAGFNRSGGVKTLVVLANAMAAKGWRVRMIVPDYAANSPFDLAAAVNLVRLATGSLPLMLRKVIYYARLATRAAVGVDLCLANFYLTVYCVLLSKIRNPRAQVVYFLQGDEAVSHGTLAEANRLSQLLRYLLARWSYRLPVRIICISNWLKRRIGRPDSTVVNQGLNLEMFFPARGRSSPQTTVVIGTIGSISEAKGYQYFCRAMELLADRSEFEIVVAVQEDLKLPQGVPACKVVALTEAQMAKFYSRCDIFVFASLSEGFGLPPLEAMACGCAVVTTECGGVAEFARHEVNSLMVPPGDPVSLSRSISRLCLDPGLRARLGQQGVRTAQGFDRSQMVSRFLEVLAS